MESTLEAFRTELVAAGADYVCSTPLGGQIARVRFIGSFQQRDVVWDAEIVALGTEEATQFIDIGAAGPQGLAIRIGLKLERIDLPALLKTLIMVRNYRRLRSGRHAFGAY
jgi:hypothetical protein